MAIVTGGRGARGRGQRLIHAFETTARKDQTHKPVAGSDRDGTLLKACAAGLERGSIQRDTPGAQQMHALCNRTSRYGACAINTAHTLPCPPYHLPTISLPPPYTPYHLLTSSLHSLVFPEPPLPALTHRASKSLWVGTPWVATVAGSALITAWMTSSPAAAPASAWGGGGA